MKKIFDTSIKADSTTNRTNAKEKERRCNQHQQSRRIMVANSSPPLFIPQLPFHSLQPYLICGLPVVNIHSPSSSRIPAISLFQLLLYQSISILFRQLFIYLPSPEILHVLPTIYSSQDLLFNSFQGNSSICLICHVSHPYVITDFCKFSLSRLLSCFIIIHF